MTDLKTKLEAIKTYYKTLDIFSDAEQRKLKDYKDVLDEHNQTSPLLNDACEGKVNLVEEVDKLWEVVTKKHQGFLNFWKPYRTLDEDYNKQVESLEKVTCYESEKMKTGGSKAKQIASYVGKEIGSDAVTLLLYSIAFCVATSTLNMPHISLSAKWGLALVYFCGGSVAKWYITPQISNRRLRKKDFKNMKENAEFIQPIIEEVYPKAKS